MWLCRGCLGAGRAERCWAIGVARCLREQFMGPKGVASHLLGAVLGNLHATAQLVLAFSWGTSAAHRSPCCGVSSPGTTGVWGAVGKLGGSLEPVAGLQSLLSHGYVSRALGRLLPGWVVARGCQPRGAGASRAGCMGPDGLCPPINVVRGSENIPEAAHLSLIAQQHMRGWINPGGR